LLLECAALTRLDDCRQVVVGQVTGLRPGKLFGRIQDAGQFGLELRRSNHAGDVVGSLRLKECLIRPSNGLSVMATAPVAATASTF
jgi:hypothetical protein